MAKKPAGKIIKAPSNDRTIDIFSGKTHQEEQIERLEVEAKEAASTIKLSRSALDLTADAVSVISRIRNGIDVYGSAYANTNYATTINVATDGEWFLVYRTTVNSQNVCSKYCCHSYSREEFEMLISSGKEALDA